ncbi:MAG: LysO family transporter [Thermoproteota archaeon]
MRRELLGSAASGAALLLGIGAGYAFEVSADESVVMALLYVLVFASGILIGLEVDWRGVKLGALGALGVAYAVATVSASAAAAGLVGAAMGLPARLAAAAGAAAGWYSLAGPLLSVVDPLMGGVGFLSNFLREAMHIALYPVLSRRKLLRRAGIALGGATTMDTGLPVILIYGGADAAISASVQGTLITLMAPAVVSAIAGF